MGWLILNRYNGEEIDLTLTEDLPAGTRIKVTAIEIQRNRVRLGFLAPRSVTVDRSEITQRKLEEAGNAA